MGSVLFYRLIVFLLLAIAAGIVFFSMGEGFDAAPARDKTGLEAVNVRPAASDDLSAGKPPQASASDAAASDAYAVTTTTGVNQDHAGRLASALAAAERNGSMNQPQARSVTAQQAQDLLQKLSEEQARKDALPLTSPFGANGLKDRSR